MYDTRLSHWTIHVTRTNTAHTWMTRASATRRIIWLGCVDYMSSSLPYVYLMSSLIKDIVWLDMWHETWERSYCASWPYVYCASCLVFLLSTVPRVLMSTYCASCLVVYLMSTLWHMSSLIKELLCLMTLCLLCLMTRHTRKWHAHEVRDAHVTRTSTAHTCMTRTWATGRRRRIMRRTCPLIAGAAINMSQWARCETCLNMSHKHVSQRAHWDMLIAGQWAEHCVPIVGMSVKTSVLCSVKVPINRRRCHLAIETCLNRHPHNGQNVPTYICD